MASAGSLSPRPSIDLEWARNSHAPLPFTRSWTGTGWVAFSSGRRYHLRQTNFWGTECAFEAADGNPAIVRGPHDVCKQGDDTAEAQSVAGLPEAPVLLLLTWYLRILMNEDAAAVATTVIVCS
jgi:hypothetical protein